MKFEDLTIKTEVLVIGGGGAAGMAAVRAAELGRQVVLASKTVYPGGSTVIARGGWQAAIGHSDPNDHPSLHVKDTLSVGCGINDQRLVEAMANECPVVLQKLDEYGAVFARQADGRYAQKKIQGVTYPRHIHNFDKTGIGLAQGLKKAVAEHNNIQVLRHQMAVGFLIEDGRISGALLFNLKTGVLFPVQAAAVVLATGGGSGIYAVNDNLPGTTGDGYLLALEAGLSLLSMEMVEFQLCVCHPPSLIRYPPNSSAWVIRGGRLYNGRGERFMKVYDPVNLEVTTRAAINRAVAIEIARGRGTSNGGIYLDMSDIPLELIQQVGPTIYKAFQKKGIDLTHQPMELGQCSHSFLGGIAFGPRGDTAVDGLFVAGEVGGGVHGANRLGGNQLSDALAFGHIAGGSAAEFAAHQTVREPAPALIKSRADEFVSFIHPQKEYQGDTVKDLMDRLRMTNSKELGPIRTGSGLDKALKLYDSAEEILPRLPIAQKDSPEMVRAKWETKAILTTSRAIALAAQYRKESRGMHYRDDFPEQNNDQFTGLTYVSLKKGLEVSFRPIK